MKTSLRSLFASTATTPSIESNIPKAGVVEFEADTEDPTVRYLGEKYTRNSCPMNFSSVSNHVTIRQVALCIGLLCLAGVAFAAGSGPRYTGRVLYRSNKVPVAGVLVEVVEAEDSGEPTDEVLGSTRADADGRFTVFLTAPSTKNVTLVVSAVRSSAESGGDHRQEGFDIKTHRTQLGFLPHPSATKPNTIFVERRRPGHPTDS